MGTKYVKVFIGRFQPFHNGHLKVLRAAIDIADLVVVVIGSANQHRTVKNPFTAWERKAMIKFNLRPAELAKVAIVLQEDVAGNDADWVAAVRAKVAHEAAVRFGEDEIHTTLIGCHKDSSSYYLRLYDGWALDLIPSSEALNATDVRDLYFDGKWQTAGRELFDYTVNLPPATASFLHAFWLYQPVTYLQLSQAHINQQKEQTT